MAIPAIGASVAAANELAEAIKSLTKVFLKTVAIGESFQKEALSLGQGFSTINEKLTPTLAGLRGSVENKLTVGITALKAGLDGNILGVNILANQQQLTGQNWKQTASVFADLKAQGRLQNDELDSLAVVTKWAGETYGVESSKLVSALSNLSRSFLNMGLLGLGPTIQKAIVLLTSKLGPEYAGMLTDTVNTIFDSSVENLGKMAQLGMGGIQNAILAADGNVQRTMDTLMEGVAKGAGVFESIQNGGVWEGIVAASNSLGDAGKKMTALSNAYATSIRDTVEVNRDYADSIEAVWSEVMNPIKDFFKDNYDSFKEFGIVIADITTKFTTHISTWLVDFGKDNFRGLLLDIALGFSVAVDSIIYRLGTYADYLDSIEDTKNLINPFDPIKSAEAVMGVTLGVLGAGWIQNVNAQSEIARGMLEVGNYYKEETKNKRDGGFKTALTRFLEGADRSSPLARIAEATEEVAENTRKPTSPNFLSFSDQSLASSMRSILGINEDKGLGLLQQLVDLTERSLEKESKSLPLAH